MATRAAGESHRGRYLILHGWENHQPPGHWQHWLAGRLTALGHEVHYPQLPNADEPVLADWLTVIEGQLQQTVPEELTVICHSLSCMAWLHLADQGSTWLPVGRLLFVAPPGPKFLATVPVLAGFQPPASDQYVIAKSVLTTPRLACAEADPYCSPERADEVYPGVFDIDVIENARHFDISAGYREWPSVLAWCADSKVRLGPAG